MLSMAESQLPAPTRPDFGDVRELHDHALVHARHANRKWNRFLWEGTTRHGETDVALTGTTPVEQLADAVRRLSSQAVDVYAVDLTTHEAASAGVTVVKVVCPQLQPLELWSCPYDDSRRLAAVLGADPTTIGVVDSGAPHPLA